MRTLVVIEERLSAVVSVITTESTTMASAPATPALPTTQGCRMYMMTPRMVSVVGVNTPAKVPKACFVVNLGALMAGLFLAWVRRLCGTSSEYRVISDDRQGL